MLDIKEIITKLSHDINHEQFNETRLRAEREAFQLLEQKIGRMTIEDIGNFSSLCNTEFINSRGKKEVRRRFESGFKGKCVFSWKENISSFNEWTKAFYTANQYDLENLLDCFWKNKKNLLYAGTILPTIILYLKNEQYGTKFNIFTQNLNTAACKLTGNDIPFARKYSSYTQYNNTINAIMEKNSIQFQQRDFILSQIFNF